MSTTSAVQDMPVVYLGDLLDAGDGAVVTLLAGETRLAAHRAVLAARSPVFAAMFQHDMLEASSGHVTVTDVEGPVLRQLLSYCYTLQVPHLPDMAPQLLAAADKYSLPALKDVCEQQVVTQLAVENAAATAVLAVRHSCPRLTAAAVAFIRAHNYKVMGTQGWADEMLNDPQSFIEVNRLLADSPTETKVPPTAEGGPAPGSHRKTPAAAATPVAPRHTPRPDDAAVSHLWSLSQEERNRRLVWAARQGAVPELRALLVAGADVDARGEWGRTALHWAANEGHEEAARCLVEGGAEVDARDSWQFTPLHLAAQWGHAAVVRLLLAASADPNVRSHEGWTPLHWAAQSGRTEAAAALLEGGADRGARSNVGKSSLDIARQYNNQQLIQLLTP